MSGRPRETLDQWLGGLAVTLHAEHGFWSRKPDGSDWIAAGPLGGSWREPALAILRDITARTPGSRIEVKAVALAWHYRLADPETGARRANELRLHLSQLLSNEPVEILAGHKVIEIRPYGFHKGRIIPPLPPERLATMTVLAMGDDRTDEDLFEQLPPEAWTVRVGRGSSRARFRLPDSLAVRAFLQQLAEAGAAEPEPTLEAVSS